MGGGVKRTWDRRPFRALLWLWTRGSRLGWLLVLASLGPFCAPAGELWLYVSDNLQVAERVTRIETLFGRAHAAGYTHVLLADSKFSRLGDVPEHYFRNAERLRAAARSNGLALVPAVFPVGYSNDLLWHDPDLAEGPPVRDARFVVRAGLARLESEAAVRLKGGDATDLKAWDGLDRSVIVVNWNHGKRESSLRFFADRGHRQLIAGYYDNPLTELDDWKVSAARVPGVIGFMYTTWRGDYGQLEAFAGRVRQP